jgi:hypothetical protein
MALQSGAGKSADSEDPPHQEQDNGANNEELAAQRHITIAVVRKSNQGITTESALYRLVTHYFIRSLRVFRRPALTAPEP